jgi:exodeoxyribonuclease V gamma subunit
MGAPFQLHWSPRVEELAERLCEVTRGKLSSPFAREAILVGSPGLDRWVSEQLARAHGVWANPWIVTPGRFVDELLGALKIDETISPEAVRWALARELATLDGDVATYVQGDPARRYELAGHLQALFERYAQHRDQPFDDPTDWQAELWRRLEARFSGRTLRARIDALVEAIARSPRVPERVSVFGAPKLSAAHWRVLVALAERVPVHVFLPTPSLHDEPRHALVRGMGQHVRSARAALAGRVADPKGPVERALPADASMLQVLQGEMAADVARGPAVPRRGARPLAPGDRSIEIFSCHGPMREAETVRDRVLAALHEDATLRPRDVLVLTPRLAEYAPYLDAAFSADEARQVPVHIADGGALRPTAGGRALELALQALRGRFDAETVARLVGHPVVSARLRIDGEQRQTILGWLSALAVHWGADAEHRRAEGHVADLGGDVLGEENTWRVALDRLLMGVAVTSEGGARLVEGLLPMDDVEGDAAELAGRFAALIESLLALRPSFEGAHAPAAWAERIEALLDALFPSDGPLAFEREVLARRLDALFEGAELAGTDEPLTLEALLPWLEAAAAEDARGGGHSAGVLTIGALQPMRNVPFRVVALVGFGDDQFPRQVPVDSLDRLRGDPTARDVSPRDEDRGAFLDAIGSARDRLIVTYPGRDPQENAARAPSVVVAELLDVLDATFDAPGGKARDRVVHQVALSPWDARLFLPDAPVRSTSKLFEAGAKVALRDPGPEPPFFPKRLREETDGVLELGRLARTLGKPVERPLADRLQIKPAGAERGPSADDPTGLDALQEWQLRQRAFELLGRGVSAADAATLLRSTGWLPPGNAGLAGLDDAVRAAIELHEAAQAERAGGAGAPHAVDLEVHGEGGLRVRGALEQLYEGGRVVVRPSKIRLEDAVNLWVHHVVLCIARPAGVRARSVALGIGDEGVVRFELAPIDDADARLAQLVTLYRSARRGTLPLFGNGMLDVARALMGGGAGEDAALRKLLREHVKRHDLSGPYARRALAGGEPWAEGFRIPTSDDGLTPLAAVQQLLLPMLAAEVS